MRLSFSIIQGKFTIHRLSPESEIPTEVYRSSFYSITRTDDELSIVCPSSLSLASGNSNAGWACLKATGPLDFTLTGVLADISAILEESGISVFVLSTFDTDYFLVKADILERAKEALRNAKHTIVE
jgi:uncharacterized protein